MPIRVLLSGFEPFDAAWPNPSGDAARALDGRTIAGAAVRGVVLPVVYGEAGARLRDEIARTQPDIVIASGMGRGRAFRLELAATDRRDAPGRPDNHGVVISPLSSAKPSDYGLRGEGGGRGYPGEPEERATTLPVAAIARALNGRGILPHLSRSAGRFVCNDLFYDLMRAAEPLGVRCAGFVHVPHPRAFDGVLSQALVEDALAAAIEATVRYVAG